MVEKRKARRKKSSVVWFWVKGSLESIVVRFWVQIRRDG
jgi:hypothetical protein